MGGLGSGGARENSGPQPKSRAARVLAGTATAAERRRHAAALERAAQAVAPPSGKKPAPPAGMRRDARRVWARLGPHALAAHTLTGATADAFRELCELTVRRDRVARRIDRDGWTVKVASLTVANRKRKGKRPLAATVRHPLMTEYGRLRGEVRLLLARFRLAPLGRPLEFVEPVADDPAVDAFEEFEQPLQLGPADGDEDGEPGPTAH